MSESRTVPGQQVTPGTVLLPCIRYRDESPWDPTADTPGVLSQDRSG